MNQLLAPDDYARLNLQDMWLENLMQEVECKWLVEQTKDCNRVLDMGYGEGLTCTALAEAGRQVTMVDGSVEFCAEASLIPGVQAVHSMFEDYTPVGRFDCVIASFVLEHIPEPRKLLERARQWSNRLIVVVGNAKSYHRQLALKMGLQPRLDSLSQRDIAVGHYFVYSRQHIYNDLLATGWIPQIERGIMFKPLPNSILQTLDPRVIRAMCELDVPPDVAANVGIVCRGES